MRTITFEHPNRRGITLVEGVAASAVLATVFALVVPAIAGFHRAGQTIDARMLAIDEVRNILEESLATRSARPAADAQPFDVDAITSREVRSDVSTVLLDAELTATLTPIAEPAGQRLSVTLSYRAAESRTSNNAKQSVTLHAWLWEDAE